MGLTGVAMETMRPSGPVKLEYIERGMYKEVGPGFIVSKFRGT